MKNQVNKNAESFLLWCAANDPCGDHVMGVRGSLNMGCSKPK